VGVRSLATAQPHAIYALHADMQAF